LIVGGIGLVIWFVYKITRPKTQSAPVPSSESYSAPQLPEPPQIRQVPSRSKQTTSTNGDEFWQKSSSAGTGLGCWIYCGKGLAAVDRSGAEPALVDPDLPVDSGIQDCTVRRLSYWPTYSGASPEARSAYLHWLKTGRKVRISDHDDHPFRPKVTSCFGAWLPVISV